MADHCAVFWATWNHPASSLSSSISKTESFSCRSVKCLVYPYVLLTFYFFSWLDVPSGLRLPHCWGFGITLRHTSHGRTPLNEWSVRRRYSYLHSTQHSQQTDIHIPGGIRTRNPSKRPAAHLRRRPRGHWDRQYFSQSKCNSFPVSYEQLLHTMTHKSVKKSYGLRQRVLRKYIYWNVIY